MANLKYIFAQPEYIDGIDKDNPIEIYPVRLKDYDKFNEVSQLLRISKQHFQDNEYPLLLLILMCMEQLQLTQEELIKKLEDTFSIVTRKKVNFVSSNEHEGFLIEDGTIITTQNYELIREMILRQNLIFEQKVYKNKVVQEWADRVLESRNKNSSNITIEDFITTVSVYKGKNYEELMEYSIYQIYADFYRIRKMKKYDTDILFTSVGAEMTIEDFAEELNMFKSPYDDLFVSSDKLNKFNQVI